MYRKLFPEAKITAWFLFNIKNLEENAACGNCTGLPCTKKSWKNRTYKVVEENGELNIRFAPCTYATAFKRQERMNRHFENAKIPEIYAGKTFSDYEETTANKNALAWARQGSNLYLYGNPGTGKTFLASIMAQEFLKQGRTVIFGDVPSLLDALKGTFDTPNTTLEELTVKLETVDVLILDDLGTETSTEWAIERLYRIINTRYNARRALIVTSNYPPEVVARRLDNPKNGAAGVTGSRIISRILSLCKVATIRANDYRLERR